MNRHTHRAVSAAVAVVATLLLVAPVWAAKPEGAGADGGSGGSGGGNAGSVSVVDAVSGLESLTNNEPHVCTFFLVFDGAENGESGDWSIVDWAPTGDGTEVASGGYAMAPGGSFTTTTFDLDAGHYRVQWQAINTQTQKHKTFWVDCVTDAPEDPPVDEPADEPEDQNPPVDEPIDEPVDEPADEPADEPSDEPSDEPEDQPADEPADEPEDQNPPVDEPIDEPEDQPEEGDVESAMGGPPAPLEEPAPESLPVDEPDVEGAVAASVGGGPIVTVLPDTAMAMPTAAPVLPGLSTALGILFLVAALVTLRVPGAIARPLSD